MGLPGWKFLNEFWTKQMNLSVGTFVPSHVSGCPHHYMCIPPTGYLVIFWWGWVGLRGFTIFQPNPTLYFVEKVYSEYIRIRSLWDGHVNLYKLIYLLWWESILVSRVYTLFVRLICGPYRHICHMWISQKMYMSNSWKIFSLYRIEKFSTCHMYKNPFNPIQMGSRVWA